MDEKENILEKEKEILKKWEQTNPILYKDKDFSNILRKNFEKTGSETILLGKYFENKVIIRTVSLTNFITWMDVYKNINIWKKMVLTMFP